MPIVNNKYVSPIWINGSEPALNAQNLQDLSDTVQTLDAVPPTPIYSENINTGWKKIASWETAGGYAWTAPDLFGGKDYNVGVVVVGGGGSGGALSLVYTTGNACGTVSGGGSGFSSVGTIPVSPSASFLVVVGAGGSSKEASVSAATSSSVAGNDGGTSSFSGGIVATGGAGGLSTDNSSVSGASGGQGSPFVKFANHKIYPPTILYGGSVILNNAYTMGDTKPSVCINPFDNTVILASGGGALCYYDSLIQTSFTINGRPTSPGAATLTGSSGTGALSVDGSPGTAPGCGGGGAIICVRPEISSVLPSSTTARSARGAAGAVYIYVQGSGT